jgi:hypothetical protein
VIDVPSIDALNSTFELRSYFVVGSAANEINNPDGSTYFVCTNDFDDVNRLLSGRNFIVCDNGCESPIVEDAPKGKFESVKTVLQPFDLLEIARREATNTGN